MTPLRLRGWISTVALAAPVGVLVLGATGGLLGIPWGLALETLALVAVAAVAWLIWSTTREIQAVRKVLHRLSELAPEHWADLDPQSLGPLSPRWQHRFAPLVEHLKAVGKRLMELEERLAMQHLSPQTSAAEARLESLLESLPVPILVVEHDQVVLLNGAARRAWELQGEDHLPLSLERLGEWLPGLLRQLAKRPVPSSLSTEVELGPQNATRRYKVVASTFAQGMKQLASVVLLDQTALKLTQERHAEFVSAVSHEMKAPLSSIRAYTEILLDGDVEDPQQQEEFLRIIDSQADRLHRLIENLLNLARIEAGVVQVNKKVISINEILQEAVRLLRPTAEEKQIKLQTQLSPMCLRVLGDRDQLLQAVINLVSNAIKYTPSGGTVTVRSRLRDDMVQFEVEDTGVGIAPEDLKRIFDKFYRVRKDSHMASGTGLGLPLARSIIQDLHAGQLRAESYPGQGSIFIATLPPAGKLAAASDEPSSALAAQSS